MLDLLLFLRLGIRHVFAVGHHLGRHRRAERINSVSRRYLGKLCVAEPRVVFSIFGAFLCHGLQPRLRLRELPTYRAAHRLSTAAWALLPRAVLVVGRLVEAAEDVAVAEAGWAHLQGVGLGQWCGADERLTVRVYRRADGGVADVIPHRGGAGTGRGDVVVIAQELAAQVVLRTCPCIPGLAAVQRLKLA